MNELRYYTLLPYINGFTLLLALGVLALCAINIGLRHLLICPACGELCAGQIVYEMHYEDVHTDAEIDVDVPAQAWAFDMEQAA